MKNRNQLWKTCLAAVGFALGTAGLSHAQIIECCSDVFYLENVSASNQPPSEIYGDIVYAGTNNCSPSGTTVEVNSSVTINGGAIVLMPGTTYNSGTLVASGGCNESAAYNYYASHGIQKLLVPNVFTPNGDGINDVYTINVNNAKYFLVRVWQQINGNMQVIYYAEGDVVCNWPVLWDGNAGVNTSSFANQTMFAIDHAFSNCAGWDNSLENNRVWVAVFRSADATVEEMTEDFLPPQNMQWLGTEDLAQNNNHFSVAPNPSTGKFTLSFDHPDLSGELHILDLQGREIRVEPDRSGINEITVDLSSEPKGVYLLHFTHNGTRYVERLVLN